MPPRKRPTPKAKSAKATDKKTARDPKTQAASDLPFRYITSPTAPDDFYVDGLGRMIVSRDVAKLDFYRSEGVEPEEKKELRAFAKRIVLPRSALPELLKILQDYSEVIRQIAQKTAQSSETQAKD